MREKIFNIIEPKSGANKYANIYDGAMVLVIFASFVPLFFKTLTPVTRWIEVVCTILFCIDYLLRWITADFKLQKKGIIPFLIYPFTLIAILDLLSILPGLIAIHPSLRLLRAVRLIQALRLLRLVRVVRYSRNLDTLANVFKKQRHALILVTIMVVSYIGMSAIVIFQVEPYTFKNYLDALYWSTISLTTVGYGDIVPVSTTGKIISMISSLVGIAVIALPSGIITAGYLSEVGGEDNKKDDSEDS